MDRQLIPETKSDALDETDLEMFSSMVQIWL